MKKYIDFNYFKEILNYLVEDEEVWFACDDGDECDWVYCFKQIWYNGIEAILYHDPKSNQLGLIQEGVYISKNDEIAEVWESMHECEESKFYLMMDKNG